MSESRSSWTKVVWMLISMSESLCAFFMSLQHVYATCLRTFACSSLLDWKYSVISCGKSFNIMLSVWLAILPTNMQLLLLLSVTCDVILSASKVIDFNTRSECTLYNSNTKLYVSSDNSSVGSVLTVNIECTKVSIGPANISIFDSITCLAKS